MYNGKYARRPAKHRRYNKRFVTMVLSLLLLVGMAIGGTLAYLVASTKDVDNSFTPVPVTCAVSENFTDGINKKNVSAINTSDVDVWLRIELISYRVSTETGDRIGGTAPIPTIMPKTGWIEKDGFYYYTSPVAPDTVAPALVDSIALTGAYNDADGGKQVIEVMAEAIQARPDAAVQAAWGVKVNTADDGTRTLTAS